MTNLSNSNNKKIIPAVSIKTACTGASNKANELGMRPMQERAFDKRGEQYLLIKSPPASGKSRALMFIALDKLINQGIKKVLIVVPERSIGSSFADEELSKYGFWTDWKVKAHWNLCNVPNADDEKVAQSKVKAVGEFFASEDQILVCTHATFRFAVEELGIEVFDDCLIAIDEFHHVSSNPDNKLGSQLVQFLERDKTHIVAMTGSYFRGDSEAVLSPIDESKFETVTYTFFEQLNGYTYLKSLDISYFFYTGKYTDAVMKVLDPSIKTIIHIPNVNSRESTKIGKHLEVEHIMDELGVWKGVDDKTGFHLIEVSTELGDKRILKVADLVDDSDAVQRSKVLTSLKDPAQRSNRDHVDIIIALGMAKEGFDWIWCEHALTIGYRSSLTEIVQIIGRTTRDAEGKYSAKFTNLIAEPDASEKLVVEAVNDMLKAIAASLLMEQVLAPRFEFTPKDQGELDGFDYGESGYQEGRTNVGVNNKTGQIHVEINGIKKPKSAEANRICKEDLNEIITAFVQNKSAIERGLFDQENIVPEELTQLVLGKIVQEKYPELESEDQEAVRQHAIAAFNLIQQAKKEIEQVQQTLGDSSRTLGDDKKEKSESNMDFIHGVKRFMNVRDLDIDLIDHINPFESAYSVLSKAMDESILRQVQSHISTKRINLSFDEAKDLAIRAAQFKRERGRLPDINSQDAWEKRMAEGVAAFTRFKAQEREKSNT